MDLRLIEPALQPVAEKLLNQERISDQEALALYDSRDLNGLGILADSVRKRLHGDIATYINNRYINYSNVCILSCQFCAFGAKKREDHAFEKSLPEIVALTKQAVAEGATEIHMVGGLHPSLSGEWYLELLREMKSTSEELVIKAFTAVEIRHLSDRVYKLPLRETFELLRQNGLGAITGGGAEIFHPEIRHQICKGKETAEEWAEVHRTWHEMGGRSTCTMLYGHIEEPWHRIDHLRRLREIQDETGGFTALVPFAFEPDGARPGVLRGIKRAQAIEELRNLAIARIYLDNIPHLTAYWISMGLPLAQVALNYGVDDLHGTIVEEKIFHMAGAATPAGLTSAELQKAIREAGRIPLARNSFYQPIGADAATAVA